MVRPPRAERPPMGEIFVKRAWGIGPVTWCGRRAGGTVLLAFPRRCRVSCRRAAVGQAGAPAAVAPLRARARTNELDAGKRGPRIGGEERSACGCGLPGVVRVRRSGSHIHPFGARPGRGHDRAIRGRAAQSVRRARQGRLRMFFELARGLATPPACHLRCFSGAGTAAGCGTAPSASVSRCQARVSSLRATAVVAIFLPRRRAMAW
jgi:hypothetical protein